MKINNTINTDTVVAVNNREQLENKEGVQQVEQAKVKNGAVKGSELNLIQDPVEEKKKKAMEDAMEFIKNQYKTDLEVDDVLDECRDTIKSSKNDMKEAAGELSDIKKQKEELGEMYADKDDEEYQMRLKELNEAASEWQKRYDNANKMLGAATKGIKSIKQEILKHHGMVDANKLAEKSLKAASDEIIGMLKDEAIDKIDEDMDEVIEEAKETKEENAKKDAELEEVRAEREKQAQEIEEELKKEKQRDAKIGPGKFKSVEVDEILQKHREVVQNTEQILQEQKLLEEEIKGIMVDSQI